MSKKLISVLKELNRRAERNGLVSNLHPGQKRILDAMERSRFIVIRSARRWGKTEGLLRIGLDIADKMNARCLYLAMYRTNAKAIAWSIAQDLNLCLNWTPNLVELALRGPGKRELIIAGADRPDLARLLRGLKNCVVIIDEAQSWSLDLREFCNSTLRHTLTDLRGYLLMAGTPGWDEDSFFYMTSNGKEPGWEVVIGNTLENPYTNVQQKEEMDELLESCPTANEQPWWKREYEGMWVSDNRNLVYPFDNGNILHNWTKQANKRILSIDWGSTNESAFVVAEFNPTINNKLIYVDAFEQANLSLNDYINIITDFRDRWNPILTIADPGGTNKALTDEIATRCKIPIINAEKTDKEAAIAAMVRDLSLGIIQVAVPQCEMLIDCWKKLQWHKQENKPREEKGKNHISDAALYARRAAWNYIHKPSPPPLTEEQKMFKKAKEQVERENKLLRKRYGG